MKRSPGWVKFFGWQVERDNGTPLFRQLYLQIRAAILSLTLAPGTRLPSTRDLASRLRLARASVVSAYEQLLAEGYLVGKVGSGTYISSDLPERLVRRPVARAPATIRRHPRVPTPATRLERLAQSTGESDHRPFAMGRCRVDVRTVETWRRLTQQTLRGLGPAHLGYSDARGLPELCQTLCEYLRAARAVRCEPEQIVVTAGTQQAVDLAIRLLFEPGDEAWVEDPGYPMTRAALLAAGVRPRAVPVDSHGLDVRAGRRTAPKARAAFVTPSNHYPLGVVLSMPRRLELLAWARESAAWIVEDDFDSEFRYSGRPLASLQGLDDGERVIYTGTFNKVLFPGLRIGFAVVPFPLLRAFVTARYLVDRHPPSLSQAVAATFMRQGHFTTHLRRMRQLYREQRDALALELEHRAGAELMLDVPDHGMHLVAYLRHGRADIAVERAAHTHGVVARAISSLYMAAPPQSGLLLGFTGFAPETIAPAVARLVASFGDIARRREIRLGSPARRSSEQG